MHPAPSRDSLYRWRFGAVEFDEARWELQVAGLPVEIEQRPLQVLALLLRHAGEVVTKQELFDQVWTGRVTVDHVLSTAVGKLRRALEAGGEARIATLPRIGYRFEGRVERTAVGQQPGSSLQLEAGQPVPHRPHFLLERPLAQTLGSEVWLARQPRSRDCRVFKFSLDGRRLGAIKREATVARLLRDALGERDDLTRVVDWNFEAPPYFLESSFGGPSLPEWAADGHLADLTRAQRLAFCAGIADTVAAAHGVGVLHKDLKPANILVAADGDGWRPVLTDFGSSHLLQPERLEALGITRLGMTVEDAGDISAGTPLYLAPELVAGGTPTVRSDVYALGVLVYQLLVGDLRRPMAPGWERGLDDALLCEDIALATDADPERRPGDAAELARRLRTLPQRHAERALQEQAARDAASTRQALERARARRPWIAATIGVLGLGLVASSLLWVHSERQRAAAAVQADRAEAVARFLSEDLLGALSPGGSGYERDPRMRDVLEQAAIRIEQRLADDPATRGAVHAALGQAWRTLGDRERAVTHLREADREHTRAFGDADPRTLQARYALVRTLAYLGTQAAFDEAQHLLDATDAHAGALLRGDTTTALEAATARGLLQFQQLKIAPALQAWQRADRLQRLLRPDDIQTAAMIREHLADGALREGRLDEAVERLRALLADPLFSAADIGDVRVAGQQAMLARALRNQGHYAQALPLALQAAATSERILGTDDYSTLIQLSTVASIHDLAGHCALALPVARTVRSRMAARYGEDRQATLVETGNLGLKEHACGDGAAGLAWLRQAEAGLRGQFGADNVAAQRFRHALAQAFADAGRWREASEMADGLDTGILLGGSDDPAEAARLQALRGEILLGLGDAAPGRALLSEALATLSSEDAADSTELQRLRGLLAASP